MESEDGTGGRRPWLGDVDCHPPISFNYIRQATIFVTCLFIIPIISLSFLNQKQIIPCRSICPIPYLDVKRISVIIIIYGKMGSEYVWQQKKNRLKKED